MNISTYCHTAAGNALVMGVLGDRETAFRHEILGREQFFHCLDLERKRADRAGCRFAVAFMRANERLAETDCHAMEGMVAALSSCIRSTDILYADRSSAGVIFTELGCATNKVAMTALFSRIGAVLAETLSGEQVGLVDTSIHLYPDEWSRLEAADASPASDAAVRVKRAIDLVGSLLGLLVLSPVLLAIAAFIKLTSAGPVFFRQQRVGLHGRRFTFLKFRSMYTGSDESVHEEHMKSLILRRSEGIPTNRAAGTNKLANDRRVTPVGRILRRTSLDELPQLINVLLGDMSLVGPRPAIVYELKWYEHWQKRRLSVKPGMTGLWQVTGRSRVSFTDMVRLDLEYVMSWSLALDCKILLKTPRAVVMGDGAC